MRNRIVILSLSLLAFAAIGAAPTVSTLTATLSDRTTVQITDPQTVAMAQAFVFAQQMGIPTSQPATAPATLPTAPVAAYVVDQVNGNDANAGTAAAPFQTIQKAASVATSGQVVAILPGTYRETVTPAASGATFIGSGPSTIISGTALAPVDLGDGKNAVYVGGVKLPEASFDSTFQGVTVSQNAAPSGTPIAVTIKDAKLTQPADFWVGGDIWFRPGQQWVAQTGIVTASAPGTLTFSAVAMGLSYNQPIAGNPYSLIGPMVQPSAGEVTINGAKIAFGTPSQAANAEYKARQWGFDLAGRSNVQVQNLALFACSIRDAAGDKGNVLSNLRIAEVSQDRAKANGWKDNATTGIQFFGNSDVVQDTRVQGSTGNGIVLAGNNGLVQRCTLSDLDSAAGNECGVLLYGSGHTVSQCTIYNCGRDGIKGSGTVNWTVKNCLIHDVMQLTTDGGGIYTYANATKTPQNATWFQNQIYNVRTGNFGGCSYYPDDNSNGVVIDSCLAYNADHAIKINSTPNNIKVVNFSDYGCTDSIIGDGTTNWSTCQFLGSMFTARINSHVGGTFANNFMTASSYTAPTKGDFTLIAGSAPALAGAGCYGKGQWTAGDPNTYSVPLPPPVIDPPNTTPPVVVGAVLYAQEMAATDRKQVAISAFPPKTAAMATAQTVGAANVQAWTYTVAGVPCFSVHFDIPHLPRTAEYLSSVGSIIRKYAVPAGMQ